LRYEKKKRNGSFEIPKKIKKIKKPFLSEGIKPDNDLKPLFSPVTPMFLGYKQGLWALLIRRTKIVMNYDTFSKITPLGKVKYVTIISSIIGRITMSEIVKVVGIICGLALTVLSSVGFYLVAIDLVYFVDIVFLYAWFIALLLLFVSGFYLVWYYYQSRAESVKNL
jgi:hypothetical protein